MPATISQAVRLAARPPIETIQVVATLPRTLDRDRPAGQDARLLAGMLRGHPDLVLITGANSLRVF